MTQVPIIVALVAGLVSFLSPCVLPLIPGYLAYLAAGASGVFRRREVFFCFSRVGGIIIIFFGLYLTGWLRLGFLERQWRFKLAGKRGSYGASALFGAAFAAGGAPCVGAVLGAILGLAASEPGIAFGLLMAYAIGFSIPFLLVGLFTDQATRLIARLGIFTIWANRLFGLFLVGLGVLVFTQQLSRLANFGLLEFLIR